MALQILPIKIVLLLNYSTFEKVPIMIRLITFTFFIFPKISQSIQSFKQLNSSRKDQTQKKPQQVWFNVHPKMFKLVRSERFELPTP